MGKPQGQHEAKTATDRDETNEAHHIHSLRLPCSSLAIVHNATVPLLLGLADEAALSCSAGRRRSRKQMQCLELEGRSMG